MYVFPRAGRPTMEMTVGLLMTLGHDAEKKKNNHIHKEPKKTTFESSQCMFTTFLLSPLDEVH